MSKIRGLKRLHNLWGNPSPLLRTTILTFFLVDVTLVSLLWLEGSTDSGSLINTSVGVFGTFIATFLGVYLSYYLITAEERKRSIRKEKFVLSSIWDELRFNKFVLKQIEGNFELDKLLKIKILRFLFDKFSNLYEISTKVKDGSYLAAQNSGFIAEIKSDDILNVIRQGYENCSFFQTQMLINSLDFQQKANVFSSLELAAGDSQKILRDVEDKIRSTGEELKIAAKAVEKAIDTIAKRLEKLGIKTEFEERAHLLTYKEDSQV